MVRFFTEDIVFVLKHKAATKTWLKMVAENESRQLADINIIFCSDNYLLDINNRFLSHNYYTDIITFDYSEGNKLSGDLFISIDSVKDNSSFYSNSFEDELNRVIVHGMLHLIGYDDHSEVDIAVMRSKEDFYLCLRDTM